MPVKFDEEMRVVPTRYVTKESCSLNLGLGNKFALLIIIF